MAALLLLEFLSVFSYGFNNMMGDALNRHMTGINIMVGRVTAFRPQIVFVALLIISEAFKCIAVFVIKRHYDVSDMRRRILVIDNKIPLIDDGEVHGIAFRSENIEFPISEDSGWERDIFLYLRSFLLR